MSELTIFLSGDVMTGRGIDQVLQHPVDPVLHERWAKSALDYVALAEAANGPIPRGAHPEYVWGDALALLEGLQPDARVVNLETAVTANGEPWLGKGIHYRMSPANAGVISAANVDCCVLANNHVLDWSYPGLEDTLGAVEAQGAVAAGAGRNAASANAAALIDLDGGPRLVVLAFATHSSGVDPSWAAGSDRPGVAVTDLSSDHVNQIAARIGEMARPGDVVVVSIHWGPNWGYQMPGPHRRFAHALIDRAGVDIVHGHSSHHALAMEVHRERLILYGCGDLINDYEGIGGHEIYRPDLGALYVIRMDPEAGLLDVELTPMRMRRFRLEMAGSEDREWVRERLSSEGERYGTRLESSGRSLHLRW
jgi:poly-gamma-glutamate capsule biosynthesis protein CapA/YwtB (metallophosphatase superfamily)